MSKHEYNMGHAKRGKAVIFNQFKFDRMPTKPRHGTQYDAKALQVILELFGFKVDICNDYTADKIEKKLLEVSKEDHSKSDCVLVTVMTHGSKDKLGAKDKLYATETLWKHFIGNNCRSLIGKPKIFIVQACKGSVPDAGVDFETDDIPFQGGAAAASLSKYPSASDLLIAYATFDGYVSIRYPDSGTRFIQTLCSKLLSKFEENHLEDIFKFVNNKMVRKYKDSKVQQVAKIESTCTKFIYLEPKRTISEEEFIAILMQKNPAWEGINFFGDDDDDDDF